MRMMYVVHDDAGNSWLFFHRELARSYQKMFGGVLVPTPMTRDVAIALTTLQAERIRRETGIGTRA